MKINRFVKELPRALLIGFSIFIVLTLIQYLNGQKVVFNIDLLIMFGFTFLYSVTLHFANMILFLKLDFYFKADRFSKKRIIVGFFSSFFVTLFVIFLLRVFISIVIYNGTWQNFINKENPSDYVMSTIFTFIVLLIIHFIYLYKWYQENKVKEQKVIAGNASAQFESLKSQIDPHFLFNSLNVLSSLIEESPEKAQKFTTSLSKIYRYVLEQRDKELVSVKEELDFAKTYINLLYMRFEDSIVCELPAIENFKETENDLKVVPLSLQLLLENTIKHNIANEKNLLTITIKIEDTYLTIQNNLQKKDSLSNRKGVGLQNIFNRYAILTDRKVLIEETADSFKVKLPILTKQITYMNNSNTALTNQEEAYLKAKERVTAIKTFYANLTSYCIVIPSMAIINILAGGFKWFWFPMLGWGMGVTFHAIEAFGVFKNWEEKKLNQILNKETKTNTKWN